MQRFEYKVIPAPKRGEKARGVRTTEDRFALALTHLMNDLGADGWDYVRADALPCDERAGWTGTRTVFLNVLVFRRPIADLNEAPESRPVFHLSHEMPAVPAPRLGPAEMPLTAPAPAVGPALAGRAATDRAAV